ncbi:hypothetical protein HD806DRAFT_423418 [Xylariaceae sp. AK1471]|nr:hypothetical protein HD806DRAFT_423418 [Xylariaceae sp. AK1471]
MMILLGLDFIAATVSIAVLAAWRAVQRLEKASYWTLRLRLSLLEPYLQTGWALTSSSAVVHLLWVLSNDGHTRKSLWDLPSHSIGAVIYLLIGIVLVLTADFCYATLQNLPYLRLRWKAWSGQSRTGIPSDMAQYIGGQEDWISLSQSAAKIERHAVDQFSESIRGQNDGIIWDPVDLLRARALQKSPGLTWRPQAVDKPGVYQPTSSTASVSLLWGENLGFQRRCSRGIISVPPYLLATSPVMQSGLSGRAICLAYGILSRNKGLEPRSLICNLHKKNSFRQWEEASVWPHPAKTLRGFYYAELDKAFSLLGESYVIAATELALLLADVDHSVINWWLDRGFEHQDLDFNHMAYDHGASSPDLDRLYRGHYAAMLISLSFASQQPSMRPELTVFEAVCELENVSVPDWASSPAMEARREAEIQAYSPSLQRIIQALI